MTKRRDPKTTEWQIAVDAAARARLRDVEFTLGHPPVRWSYPPPPLAQRSSRFLELDRLIAAEPPDDAACDHEWRRYGRDRHSRQRLQCKLCRKVSLIAEINRKTQP